MDSMPPPVEFNGAAVPPKFKEPIHKPDDHRIMGEFVKEYQGTYAYIHEEWQRFDAERGIWYPAERQIKRDMIKFLASKRFSGVNVNNSRVNGVLDMAQNYMPETDEIPIFPDLIPLANGVYNIVSGEFSGHKAAYFFNHAMGFDYEPDAYPSDFLTFLDQIIVDEDGKTDYPTIDFMAEMVGYSLWGDNRLQASFFFHGDGGTGKSTMLEMMQKLTNSKMTIDLENMRDHDLAELDGKRLVVFNELDKGATIPEAAFKRLVSSDRILARRLYQNPFTFQPICTLVGAMNHLPRIKDRSAGVFRRIYVIPFRKKVANPDPYLPQKLESEMAGIFNWAMEGLSNLRKRGHFLPSQNVIRAIEAWKLSEDIERQFLLSEFVLLGKDYTTTSQDLYNAFKAWAHDGGHRAKSRNVIAEDWYRLGLVKEKDAITRRVVWRGVGLVSNQDGSPPPRATRVMVDQEHKNEVQKRLEII